jgi:hypothetical protein
MRNLALRQAFAAARRADASEAKAAAALALPSDPLAASLEVRLSAASTLIFALMCLSISSAFSTGDK